MTEGKAGHTAGPGCDQRKLICPRRDFLESEVIGLQIALDACVDKGSYEMALAALQKWLAYDNLDEADFTHYGPMLAYAEAVEATRGAISKALGQSPLPMGENKRGESNG